MARAKYDDLWAPKLKVVEPEPIKESIPSPPPPPPPVEISEPEYVKPQILKNVNEEISNYANDENRNYSNDVLRKKVNTQLRKKPTRKSRVNAMIQEEHWEKLNLYAVKNKLFIADVLEEMIDNLDLRKNVKKKGALIEHDTDLGFDLDDDHHHRTKTIYEELTGNPWVKHDNKAYKEVANIPIDILEAWMQEIFDRRGIHPRHFAYFLTGIEKDKNANKQPPPPNYFRKRYEEVFKFVRDKNVGRVLDDYEFREQVKDKLSELKLARKDDLIDEMMKRRP